MKLAKIKFLKIITKLKKSKTLWIAIVIYNAMSLDE